MDTTNLLLSIVIALQCYTIWFLRRKKRIKLDFNLSKWILDSFESNLIKTNYLKDLKKN